MSTEQVSEEVRFVSTEQVSAGQAPPGEAARAYLAALAWDGVRRVDTWLAPSAPPEGAALRELVAARLWLLSAAARALRPGCQVGGLLALAGERGSGRTLLVEALAGPLGGFSCFGSGQLGSRGSMLHLRDLWLAELDLPPPATRARAEVLDFAARREDVVRLPYARAHSRSPRACVFAAAVPLPDLPGRVRGGDELGLWTVRVGRVDAVRYAASRDQLWAEAASRIRSGERWLPTEEEERLLHPEPESPAPDLGAEVRAWWVGGRREGLVTVERVAAALRPRAELTRALRVELGHAMRRAGFRAQVIKLDGKRVTVYEAGSRP